jgi:hypothetical protein
MKHKLATGLAALALGALAMVTPANAASVSRGGVVVRLQANTVTQGGRALTSGAEVEPGTLVSLSACITTTGHNCAHTPKLGNFRGDYLYVCGRWQSGPQHQSGWQPLYLGIAADRTLPDIWQEYNPDYNVDTLDYFAFISRSDRYRLGSPCPVVSPGLPQAAELSISWVTCANGCPPPNWSTLQPRPARPVKALRARSAHRRRSPA